jgi:hypothetical protein
MVPAAFFTSFSCMEQVNSINCVWNDLVVDCVHRQVLLKNNREQRLGSSICFHSQLKGGDTLLGSLEKAVIDVSSFKGTQQNTRLSPHLKTEADSVPEKLRPLMFYITVLFNLGYAKTCYSNQNETQELLEP